MLRTIDRYIIKETLPLVFLCLLVLTFMLMIPPIMDQAQQLLTKGVDFATVATLMGLLIPQGLGVTIPMAFLIGLLMALGRLSGDRETVAMQACGISITRMLRPVAVLALLATAVTSYVMIAALPNSNQAFREIVFRQLASYTADQVEPQVSEASTNRAPSGLMSSSRLPRTKVSQSCMLRKKAESSLTMRPRR